MNPLLNSFLSFANPNPRRSLLLDGRPSCLLMSEFTATPESSRSLSFVLEPRVSKIPGAGQGLCKFFCFGYESETDPHSDPFLSSLPALASCLTRC